MISATMPGVMPAAMPANIVLAKFLKAKHLPVEMKKTGENKYATYNNRIAYDGNSNKLSIKKFVPVLNGNKYELYLTTQEWEIYVDGDKLDGRLLQ